MHIGMFSRRHRGINRITFHPRPEYVRGGGGALLVLVLIAAVVAAVGAAIWQLAQKLM